MPVIETLIDAHSPDFARNRDALLASLQHLRLLEQNLLSKAQPPSEPFNGFHRAYLPDVLKTEH